MNVIIACSGPQLNDIDLPEGVPVCAISTAIQSIREPDVWAFIDKPREQYGKIKDVLVNECVLKVCPDYCRRFFHSRDVKNVEYVDYELHKNAAKATRAIAKKDSAIMKLTHKSVLMATQYLVKAGYTTLYYAGMDLTSQKEQTHSWGGVCCSDKARRYNRFHDEILKTFTAWVPIVEAMGVKFVSLTPTSPINSIMEPYDGRRNIPRRSA